MSPHSVHIVRNWIYAPATWCGNQLCGKPQESQTCKVCTVLVQEWSPAAPLLLVFVHWIGSPRCRFFVFCVLDSSKATKLCSYQSCIVHISWVVNLYPLHQMVQTYQLMQLLPIVQFLRQTTMHRACSAWLWLCFCGFCRHGVMGATVCLFPCRPLFGCILHKWHQ